MRPHTFASGPPRAALPRVAVVGSGIAGLAAAWHLREVAEVTLFEADAHLGGHAHTVDVTVDGQTFGVDTGFLVCNRRTYPGLMPLFDALGVALAPSQMGFSVQVRDAAGRSRREWAGTGLAGLFAQPRHLASPRFWGMLRDILRFNAVATAMARRQDGAAAHDHGETTGAFLARIGLGAAFRDDYLIPMVACIWSCAPAQMMAFPIATLVRFCHNHGLLQVVNQPQWYTVRGGSREYVRRLTAGLSVRLNTAVTGLARGPRGVSLHSAAGTEAFDAAVLAGHSDQTLRLLGDAATVRERAVLAAVAYQPNRAVLHTDATLLPQRKAAWAAWNHESRQGDAGVPAVCLHYWLNALQPLPTTTPVIVSLNPLREPAPGTVLGTFDYAHPIFDHAAIAAQQQLPALHAEAGAQRTWLAGAWMGYGFHEDGYQAGRRAAEGVRAALELPSLAALTANANAPATATAPHG